VFVSGLTADVRLANVPNDAVRSGSAPNENKRDGVPFLRRADEGVAGKQACNDRLTSGRKVRQLEARVDRARLARVAAV
jgi:hypothetical protein